LTLQAFGLPTIMYRTTPFAFLWLEKVSPAHAPTIELRNFSCNTYVRKTNGPALKIDRQASTNNLEISTGVTVRNSDYRSTNEFLVLLARLFLVKIEIFGSLAPQLQDFALLRHNSLLVWSGLGGPGIISTLVSGLMGTCEPKLFYVLVAEQIQC
jgi:hypothetical protein